MTAPQSPALCPICKEIPVPSAEDVCEDCVAQAEGNIIDALIPFRETAQRYHDKLRERFGEGL